MILRNKVVSYFINSLASSIAGRFVERSGHHFTAQASAYPGLKEAEQQNINGGKALAEAG
jgi:hypothetical protein